MRTSAADAVNLAARLGIAGLNTDEFRAKCEELADEGADTIEARISFLAKLEPESDTVAHYVAKGGSKWTAAQAVAVITDFAPEWLYDCATNRRRQVK